MKRYVQFGCGLTAPAEWINYDSSPTLRLERLPIIGKLKKKPLFPQNVIYGDVVKGLPEAPDSCDGIYCSHVLEHLAYNDFVTTLKNTYKLLKPGGTFRGVVPDLKAEVQNYLDKYDKVEAPANELMLSTRLGSEDRPKTLAAGIKSHLGNTKHFWMWDYKSLACELKKAGFINIRQCQFGDSGDPFFSLVEEEDRFFMAAAFDCQK